MSSVVDRLEALQAELTAAVDDAFTREQIADLPDAELMRLLQATGAMQRGIDAVQVEATVRVRARSEGMRGERMTTSYGCSRPADLLEMVLRVDRRTASRLVKAAGLTSRVRGVTDAVPQPARYDRLRRR